MLDEIVQLGFDRVDLGPGLRPSLLAGVARFLVENELRVVSVSNLCLQPVETAADVFDWSSLSAFQRDRTAKLTMETIDYAASIGADRVVLHLGSLPLPPYTQTLLNRIKQGKLLDRRYVETKLRAIKQRESTDIIGRVLEWLQPVIAHATDHSIVLGVENGSGIEAIPGESEWDNILGAARKKTLGYWHDFGNAQIRDNLTLIDHEEFFLSMLPRMVGCYVQDVKFPDVVGLPPFTGCVPFAHMIPRVPEGVPMVWRMSPKVDSEAIARARERWVNFAENR